MTGLPRSLSEQTTVFCDFDGPIVNVSDRYYSTYCLALKDTEGFYREFSPQYQVVKPLPSSVLTKEQFWQMKQNRVPDREIAKRSGLSEEKIDFFLARVVKIVNRADLLDRDTLQPGVSWALNLLRTQGVKLILVTLRDRLEATNFLEQHGLRKLFTGIYGTDDSQAAYQNYTEIKTYLLDRAMKDRLPTTAHPHDSWMIGDTEADILAGKAMGIPTIGLTCGIRSYRQLSQLQPTAIEPDLLSAAHRLVGMGCLQACC
jgi:phosphoglycolate phosphatase